MADFIKEYWGVLAGLLGGLVWLVRLEARGLSNTREVERLWEQRREDLDTAKESRKLTNETLAEIRADVKALLTRPR